MNFVHLVCHLAVVSSCTALTLPFVNEVIARVTARQGLPGRRVATEDSDSHLDTVQLGTKYGYPVEAHKVITEDGYILTVHRIPNGKNAPPAPPGGRPIVWLQHGLLTCSSDWLFQNKYPPLGYRLADAGYDVWLGNARGNYYSKSHVSLDTRSREYWSFSWHEMGKYDLPAGFDYIRNITGQPDLYYVGHSMGTTMFFAAMATRPEYNSRIRLMSALAPVAYLEDTLSPIKYLNGVVKQFGNFGAFEFFPKTRSIEFFGTVFCRPNGLPRLDCSNFIFLICGFDGEQFNRSMITDIMGHLPAGTSSWVVGHYAQNLGTNKFSMFDYGNRRDNLRQYGQESPPQYNISKITAPIALYWSTNDWLAGKSDVNHLAKQLPNLQRMYRVPHDKFNHIDFIWGIDAGSLLYDTMEEFMKDFGASEKSSVKTMQVVPTLRGGETENST